MKRITFLAMVVALFTISTAKAQIGVHVGLNFGSPAYYHPYHRVAYAAPAYYPPAYPLYPAYYHSYYRRPVVYNRYYAPRRVVYHTGYRRW